MSFDSSDCRRLIASHQSGHQSVNAARRKLELLSLLGESQSGNLKPGQWISGLEGVRYSVLGIRYSILYTRYPNTVEFGDSVGDGGVCLLAKSVSESDTRTCSHSYSHDCTTTSISTSSSHWLWFFCRCRPAGSQISESEFVYCIFCYYQSERDA